jgi:hypothetical protein
VIAIQPLAESLTGLKRATDRTASELAIRRLTDDLTQLQAARQLAEGRVAEHRKVIAAHDAKKVGGQSAIGGFVITPLCYLVYLASDALTRNVSEGSLLWFLSNCVLLCVPILGLMTIWFSLKWLLSSDPTPERKIAEKNLQAADAEVASLAQAMAQKQAEIGQHQ